MTFVEKVRKGRALLDQIEEHIEDWLSSHSVEPIHKFLGMTKPQFKRWLKDKNYLKTIVYGDPKTWAMKRGRRGTFGASKRKGELYFNLNHRLPEMNLVGAMLQDAVRLVLKKNLEKHEINPARQAYRWIRDYEDDYDMFSFINVCIALGIDPSYLRTNILKVLGKPYPILKKNYHTFSVGTMNGGEDADDNDYWAMYKMGWSLMNGKNVGHYRRDKIIKEGVWRSR